MVLRAPASTPAIVRPPAPPPVGLVAAWLIYGFLLGMLFVVMPSVMSALLPIGIITTIVASQSVRIGLAQVTERIDKLALGLRQLGCWSGAILWILWLGKDGWIS